MDLIELQKHQAMAEFRRAESSKRVLRALLYASVSFSFLLLVSFSSWLPCLLHHADLHLSLFLINLPDCLWVDRKAMFFLCNIILVVIARDSGLLAFFMPERDSCDDSMKVKGQRSSEVDPYVVSSAPATSAGPTQHVPGMEKGSKPEEDEEEEEEEVVVVEEDGCVDMDELNKRFDDFIEKVKSDRKLEALQLVMVRNTQNSVHALPTSSMKGR